MSSGARRTFDRASEEVVKQLGDIEVPQRIWHLLYDERAWLRSVAEASQQQIGRKITMRLGGADVLTDVHTVGLTAQTYTL